jgi:hypothetical protein
MENLGIAMGRVVLTKPIIKKDLWAELGWAVGWVEAM